MYKMNHEIWKVQEEREAKIEAEVEAYWDERSERFSEVRQKELKSPDAAAWLSHLTKQLPKGHTLRILDIGTGSGFFSILLAGEGHDMTGIDMSAGMVHEAKKNALAFGRRATFCKMNAQELLFFDASFDAIVTRNLTWTLPDVMKAYREWHRVLKKGGILLNFDSDYGRMTFAKTKNQSSVHASVAQEELDICNKIKDALRISTHQRPAWDGFYLESLGFKVEIQEDIAAIVHRDPAMQYDKIPFFALRAVKK